MSRIPLEGVTLRAALVLGFGLTLGLWLFAGYGLTVGMARAQREAEAINDRYTRAQELLAGVQAQVLLGSVYARDLLLNPADYAATTYRVQLLNTYGAVDDGLRQYEALLVTDEERGRLGRLRHEIAAFRGTMQEMVGGVASAPTERERIALSRGLSPRREIVLRVSEEVRALHLSAFLEQQNAVADIYGSTQRRAWIQLGVALAASFGIALIATLYAGRLETRLRQQRVRDVQNTHDLQRLSAKLITAQEEERRSIARELHDEIGQALQAIKVEVSVAQRKLETSGADTEALEDVHAITDNALSTVRDLSRLLHPALLDDLGLPAVVDWYVRGFSRRHGLRVELRCEGLEDRLLPEIESAAYRIIQEALTNVARHARATECRVLLQRLPTTILLTIEDNGVGFNPAEVRDRDVRRGLGLIGIRERASELLGTLRIDSEPGRGTRVLVELPARMRGSMAEEGAEEVVNG
jgi:signal transduction histidine kinase